MAGVVNIGAMKDRVILYYLNGETKTEMGSSVPIYNAKKVWANVKPMSLESIQRNGLNMQEDNYRLICRDINLGRLIKVDYKDQEFWVVNVIPDKNKQFLTVTMKNKT